MNKRSLSVINERKPFVKQTYGRTSAKKKNREKPVNRSKKTKTRVYEIKPIVFFKPAATSNSGGRRGGAGLRRGRRAARVRVLGGGAGGLRGAGGGL